MRGVLECCEADPAFVFLEMVRWELRLTIGTLMKLKEISDWYVLYKGMRGRESSHATIRRQERKGTLT